MDTIKKLPYSLEAEQSVIGSILLDSQCLSDVFSVCRSSDFYVEAHRDIVECLYVMQNMGEEVDIITLIEALKSSGVYNDETGKEYLYRIAESVPTAKNVKKYAEIVAEKALLRNLIGVAADITDICYEQTGDISHIVDIAEQKIFQLTSNRNTKEFTTLTQAVLSTLDRLHKLQGDDRDNYMGIKTYFSDLDREITGLNNSDLVVIAARPGMGKTSFALNIAQNIAVKANKTVAIFSLEMSTEQLAERMLSSEAFVDSQKLRTGKLDDSDWEKLASASGILGQAKILLDDSTDITVSEMKSKLRRVKNLGLVIIDYLQLMGSGAKTANRVQEVSDISRSLKVMAKELNVPVITLSQLARGPESRDNKRPLLSDLRESGAIEQDADAVWFLYRDDYYNKDSEAKNICECIIAKNRHGGTGKVDLQWIGEFTRFFTQEKIHNEP